MDDKTIQYAAQLNSNLIDVIKNPENENFIDINEFVTDEENLKRFLMANHMALTNLFNKLTGNDLNYLKFNHTMNELCFEFMIPENEK